ncbi:hypothetical protein Hanom_Chr12g01097011 [Helianthus anomalus]
MNKTKTPLPLHILHDLFDATLPLSQIWGGGRFNPTTVHFNAVGHSSLPQIWLVAGDAMSGGWEWYDDRWGGGEERKKGDRGWWLFAVVGSGAVVGGRRRAVRNKCRKMSAVESDICVYNTIYYINFLNLLCLFYCYLKYLYI